MDGPQPAPRDYTGGMDLTTARKLSAITTDFYQRVSPSFSATRQHAWPGWERVCSELKIERGSRLKVLDLACGNLRFERFLAGEGITCEAWAIDSCDELVHLGEKQLPNDSVHCQHLDVASLLYESGALAHALDAPPCDLAVCFGFMHHLPLARQRADVLRAMVQSVRPGGHVAISFWQFAKDERIMAKAKPVEGGGPGDYLLGWQNEQDVWRYCHSFSKAEVDEMAEACAAQARELTRFSADGKRGDLNCYLVLERVG